MTFRNVRGLSIKIPSACTLMRALLVSVLLVASLNGSFARAQSERAQSERAQSFDLENLLPDLETERQKWKLPAVGVAIVTSESTPLLNVTGFRKLGADEKVTTQDLWHLGSCGKAMTATMIARLVQSNQLRWDMSLEEVFPELESRMNDRLKGVTLVQLLSHTSSIDANFETSRYVEEADLMAARYRVVQDAIAEKFDRQPGDFHYSNWGYTVAAAMAERVTKKTWETLMREEVFVPLKMTSAGFGGTGTIGQIDQPWPHNRLGIPVSSNGPAMDNVPTMGPAGTIHMTLSDWAKFIAEHLKGGRGEGAYLSSEHFAVLHRVVSNDYALGWGVETRDWGGKVLTHSGDNTMNHAVVWASPEKDFAVLVVTNRTSAERAVDAFCAKLIRAWLVARLKKP